MPRRQRSSMEDVSAPESAEEITSGVEVGEANSTAGTLDSPFSEFFSLPASEINNNRLQEIAQRNVARELAKTAIASTHNVLFLFDSTSIARSDADRIYRALATADREKPILLVLNSRGGDIAPAYFIAKLCRESTSRTFEVAVPRQAKSAATLICCGADAIHMGSLSELGPIDPQFGAVPALAFKHSVEQIAQLAMAYPAAQSLFSEYLSKALPIQALGYYERAAASAVQYAERLLTARVNVNITSEAANDLAKHLVYAYKDHGFAIDSREATQIFGAEVVRQNSLEYEAANALYGTLNVMEWILGRFFRRDFSFTGSVENGCWLFERGAQQNA